MIRGGADSGTFASLKVRNYRLFFIGQLVSTSGTWMQASAQSLYVQFRLGGGGRQLGILSACTFVPILVLGLWAGSVADRVDKRRLLIRVQTYMGCVAAVQTVMIVTGAARFWNICVLAFAMGVGNMFEMPSRQAFVGEMVGPETMPNAVGLNSAIFNGARVVGPALGGTIIGTLGYSWAFGLNSLSFAAIVVSLAMMRTGELFPSARRPRGPGAVREGLRYVRHSPTLRTVLLCVLVSGTLSLNFQIFVPLMAQRVFHGTEGKVVSFQILLGWGALTGSLLAARRRSPTGRVLAVSTALFAVGLLAFSASPTEFLGRVAVYVVGVAFITFMLTANATLQLASDPAMRGRVMAIYGVMFAGTTPVGAPFMGWLADTFGARTSVAIGGASSLVTLAIAVVAIRKRWLPIGAPKTDSRAAAPFLAAAPGT